MRDPDVPVYTLEERQGYFLERIFSTEVQKLHLKNRDKNCAEPQKGFRKCVSKTVYRHAYSFTEPKVSRTFFFNNALTKYNCHVGVGVLLVSTCICITDL